MVITILPIRAMLLTLLFLGYSINDKNQNFLKGFKYITCIFNYFNLFFIVTGFIVNIHVSVGRSIF